MNWVCMVFVFLIGLVAAFAVFRKAGYSSWWILVAFVPVANFIMLLVFAFADWPVLRELRFQKATPKTADPMDGPTCLSDAIKYETRGDVEEAMRRYRRIAELFAGQPVAASASADEASASVGNR